MSRFLFVSVQTVTYSFQTFYVLGRCRVDVRQEVSDYSDDYDRYGHVSVGDDYYDQDSDHHQRNLKSSDKLVS